MPCQTGRRGGYLDKRLGFCSWFHGHLSYYPGQLGRPFYLKAIGADKRLSELPQPFPPYLGVSSACVLLTERLGSSSLCSINYLFLYLFSFSEFLTSPTFPRPTSDSPLPTARSLVSVDISPGHSLTYLPRILAPCGPGNTV